MCPGSHSSREPGYAAAEMSHQPDNIFAGTQVVSQMIFQTFNGYAMSQFKRIEQDIRNHGDRIVRSARRDEEGKNIQRGPGGQLHWKHAMHLLRLLLTGAATLR